MSAIEFGKVLPCEDCGGSGNGPLNKTERARELRMAKRRGELPPLIAYPPCGVLWRNRARGQERQVQMSRDAAGATVNDTRYPHDFSDGMHAAFRMLREGDPDAMAAAGLASSPAPAGLDVERLARALVAVHALHEDLLVTPTAEAIAIAREYVRAATRPAEEDPDD